MRLANSGGRTALVHVGTSFWVAPMRWLLLWLARSRVGGSLPIFLSLLAFAFVVGLLMSLVLRSASRYGLLAGLTLPIGPLLRYLVLSRMPGMFIGAWGCTS